VLGKLRTARTVLEDSVLADQLAAIKARKLARAAASAVAPVGVVDGSPGHVSFPLPADASFVDQDNWGASSTHWAQVHTGDDLSTACGTPVLAATDGTVLVRTDQTWSGRWLVLVSTGEGRLTTWYAHMQELLVTDGASVRAGQQIGVVGEEGNATGCHLHFEVHPSGGSIYEDDTDPRGWLRAVGVYPG
jgi:murein DD-endopeptidase MepM/ murein hydrolase activator NlpD